MSDRKAIAAGETYEMRFQTTAVVCSAAMGEGATVPNAVLVVIGNRDGAAPTLLLTSPVMLDQFVRQLQRHRDDVWPDAPGEGA